MYRLDMIVAFVSGMHAVIAKVIGIWFVCLIEVSSDRRNNSSSSIRPSSFIVMAACLRAMRFLEVASAICAHTLGDSDSNSHCVTVMGVSITHSYTMLSVVLAGPLAASTSTGS